ncbi:hypothetical protein [Spirosoma aerophilum]
MPWALQQGYLRRSGQAMRLLSVFFMLTENSLLAGSLYQPADKSILPGSEWRLAVSVGVWIGVSVLGFRQFLIRCRKVFSSLRP